MDTKVPAKSTQIWQIIAKEAELYQNERAQGLTYSTENEDRGNPVSEVTDEPVSFQRARTYCFAEFLHNAFYTDRGVALKDKAHNPSTILPLTRTFVANSEYKDEFRQHNACKERCSKSRQDWLWKFMRKKIGADNETDFTDAGKTIQQQPTFGIRYSKLHHMKY